MHLRVSTVKYKGCTYRYAQLVESYRREKDGMPTKRVLANLGKLSPQQITNLRVALKAGKSGEAVVLASDLVEALECVDVLANLRYLDVLAALEAWQRLELGDLLRSVLPQTSAEVPPETVISSLAVHRCVAPASKLAACRWYPTTALPELQGIAPSRFHNTRVHEALTVLDEAEEALQARFAEHLRDRQGGYQAMFIDITDTWFHGRGPELADESRTKEGILCRKVGLVLLADQRGFPLRWKTLPGKYGEAEVMGDLVEQVASLDWVGQTPIVMDRAMGNGATIARLLNTGLRFVTAIPGNEFESWTSDIPWRPFAGIKLAGTQKSHKEDVARVCRAAAKTELDRVSNTRWVLDLGIVTRDDLGKDPPAGEDPAAKVLRQAVAFKAELEAEGITRAELARRHGTTTRSLRRYLTLTRLAPCLQDRVLVGEAKVLAIYALSDVARLPEDEQEAAFEALLQSTSARRKNGARPTVGATQEPPSPVSIRLVVTFNPEAFVAERVGASERMRDLEAFLDDLNRRLSSKSSRRKPGSIEREVGERLKRLGFASLFAVHVDRDGPHPRVRLERDDEAWQRRQRFHGFNLIAGHSELPQTAVEQVALYYSKDVIEKDFQTIKSEIELRPVHHRTDAKVRAHVTLCVLALSMNRWVEQTLAHAGQRMTAARAFEQLATVHLNHLELGTSSTYTVTDLTADQEAIVAALGLTEMVRDDVLRTRLHPRGA